MSRNVLLSSKRFLKRKAENFELSNFIESRDKTPKRGLEPVGRNDPSDIVSEGPTKRLQNVLRI